MYGPLRGHQIVRGGGWGARVLPGEFSGQQAAAGASAAEWAGLAPPDWSSASTSAFARCSAPSPSPRSPPCRPSSPGSASTPCPSPSGRISTASRRRAGWASRCWRWRRGRGCRARTPAGGWFPTSRRTRRSRTRSCSWRARSRRGRTTSTSPRTRPRCCGCSAPPPSWASWGDAPGGPLLGYYGALLALALCEEASVVRRADPPAAADSTASVCADLELALSHITASAARGMPVQADGLLGVPPSAVLDDGLRHVITTQASLSVAEAQRRRHAFLRRWADAARHEPVGPCGRLGALEAMRRDLGVPGAEDHLPEDRPPHVPKRPVALGVSRGGDEGRDERRGDRGRRVGRLCEAARRLQCGGTSSPRRSIR
eukprot:TRINITY_DN6484_c0_g1_i2.p2 TRINITY_DN6484_c0_g1~~TRINITY_DN6484_c0_g1_i2.p2  ORF type:complete len:372 (-),score=-7.23 TRINITY_DN6484_c0_g1_i2:62-1177(-)